MEAETLTAGRAPGVSRRSQRRYGQVVMHVAQSFRHQGLVRAALPLTWQMTEEGAAKILQWLPMAESLYELLPAFWTGGPILTIGRTVFEMWLGALCA